MIRYIKKRFGDVIDQRRPVGFLDLPYDIRIMIYELGAKGAHSAGESAHAILMTCRQIFIEANALLYSKSFFDMHIANGSVGMRVRIDDIKSTWEDRWDWLGYQGDPHNDAIPYEDDLSYHREWELSKARVVDRSRQALRKVCSIILKRQIKLQSLTVIIEDEDPQYRVGKHTLLNSLSVLNDIPSVNIYGEGDEFRYLENVVRGPVPGLLRLPSQIRRRIFRLLLSDDDFGRELQQTPRFRTKQPERRRLLLLNHKICEEAKALLYEETLFGFIITIYTLQCSFSQQVLRPGDLEYLHGDRFRMITKIWVKICLRCENTNSFVPGTDIEPFLRQSRLKDNIALTKVEEFCRSLARRSPLKLLHVYVVDVPMFRGPRWPNFGQLEPLLSLHGIQIARIEGDVDRKTALKMTRLMESHPSEFTRYCVHEDLIERRDMLYVKWETWLRKHNIEQ